MLARGALDAIFDGDSTLAAVASEAEFSFFVRLARRERERRVWKKQGWHHKGGGFGNTCSDKSGPLNDRFN